MAKSWISDIVGKNEWEYADHSTKRPEVKKGFLLGFVVFYFFLFFLCF